MVGVGRLRIMSGDHMICEQAKPLEVTAGGKELEGTDPDMARSHARENSAGQRSLARNRFTGHYRCQRTGRRDAQRSHRFAYDIFPQHRSKRSAPISAARKRGAARSFELHISPDALLVDNLTE